MDNGTKKIKHLAEVGAALLAVALVLVLGLAFAAEAEAFFAVWRNEGIGFEIGTLWIKDFSWSSTG